jgi:hypothetical protein
MTKRTRISRRDGWTMSSCLTSGTFATCLNCIKVRTHLSLNKDAPVPTFCPAYRHGECAGELCFRSLSQKRLALHHIVNLCGCPREFPEVGVEDLGGMFRMSDCGGTIQAAIRCDRSFYDGSRSAQFNWAAKKRAIR